jgi:translation initiation factor 3 subunit K
MAISIPFADCFFIDAANLTNRYQFNPHLTREETITNILVKALTVFPTPDFSLCLHLLPPHILNPVSTASSLPAAGDAPLSEAVQKLTTLSNLLSEANYKAFWNTLDSDDLYADLVADVSGFEELMRVRIAVTVGQSCREVERPVLESWLQLKGQDFEKFISDICGWGLDSSRGGKGGMVVIPVNKENEAKSSVVRENVQFDRKFHPPWYRYVI